MFPDVSCRQGYFIWKISRLPHSDFYWAVNYQKGFLSLRTYCRSWLLSHRPVQIRHVETVPLRGQVVSSRVVVHRTVTLIGLKKGSPGLSSYSQRLPNASAGVTNCKGVFLYLLYLQHAWNLRARRQVASPGERGPKVTNLLASLVDLCPRCLA